LLKIGATFATLIALVFVVVWVFDPRRADDYDPIAAMFHDEALVWRRQHWDTAEYKYLVANFERFKPVIKRWALAQPHAYEHEIAIGAAIAAGRPGVQFLMELARDAGPAESAELVRRLSFSLHTYSEWREEVRGFLFEVEKENTVAGYYAYLGLATSHYNYASDYSQEDREQAFREVGLEPYSDADEVAKSPGFESLVPQSQKPTPVAPAPYHGRRGP